MLSLIPTLTRTEALREKTCPAYAAAMGCAVLVGVFARLRIVLASDFPVGDGGMFYVMVQELRRNHFALPMTTGYNFAGIPFAYPPIGFYAVGLLADVTGWDVISIFRFFPLVVDTFALCTFIPLANAVLSSRSARLYAVAALGLLPMGYRWVIMGGGITRSLGDLYSILALHQAYRLYIKHEWRRAPACALFSGLTLLSHPEAAFFTAYTIALLFLFSGWSRKGLVSSAVVMAGAAVLSFPWWVTVLTRFGVGTFVNVASSDGSGPFSGLASFLVLSLTHESLFPLLEMLALLGILRTIGRRSYFLPTWLAVIFLVQSRAPDQRAVIPLALLIAIGLDEVFVPLFRQGTRVSFPIEFFERPPWDRTGAIAHVVVGVVLAMALAASTLDSPQAFAGLSGGEREALSWVATHAPANARVLVITGQPWTVDRVSEWFPALTNRRSVATVQGDEWLPGFNLRVEENQTLQTCARTDDRCLDAWQQRNGVTADTVYVAKANTGQDPTAALRISLSDDPRYSIVYNGPGATIYQRTAANQTQPTSEEPLAPSHGSPTGEI